MSSKIALFKRIAFENITKKIDTYRDFEEAVCSWWRRKYKMPDTDPRYLCKYVEDMIIEYFEDQFKDSPELLHAYGMGYDSAEEMEEERLKEIMGEEYTSEVAYFQEPSEVEKKTGKAIETDEKVDEETVVEF